MGVPRGRWIASEVMRLDTIRLVSLAQDGRMVAATQLKEGASSAYQPFFSNLLIFDVPFRAKIAILGNPLNIYRLRVY